MIKITHIDRLWASNEPVIWEMLSTDGAESLLAREREPSRYGEVQITSRESLQVALTTDLHSAVDGRGLRESDLAHINISGLLKPLDCKVQCYDVLDIRNWIARNISSNEVQFLSVSFS